MTALPDSPPDRSEWRYVRVALVVVGVIVVAVLSAWKIHDIRHPRATRLERTVACLTENRGVTPIVPAGDPLANSARAGSLRTTVEGNEVTVALAKSDSEAMKLEQYFRAVGGDLTGRLERRGRSVYVWKFVSSPTQRQAMYDCQF